MNQHLQGRILSLLSRYERGTLATCGRAGPQVSRAAYTVQSLKALQLLLPSGSEHLYNLETQAALVLLSPTWKLQGIASSESLMNIQDGLVWVFVKPVQLHVLDDDGQYAIETIDILS